MSRYDFRATVGLLLLALSVAGCGSGTAHPSPAVGESSPGSAPATTTNPPTNTPSPATAADGTNLAACHEGNCEVYTTGITVIPLDPRFGFTRFVVTHEPPDRTLIDADDPVNGNLHGYLDGTGDLNADGITMTVVSVDTIGAVLRFMPRAQ